MSDDHAAELDGDKLGEGIGDDGLPGIGNYPPDEAVGVDDTNLDAPDDVAARDARTEPDDLPGAPAPSVGDLLPPDGDDDRADAERQMLAGHGSTDGDASELPAEIDAIHEID